MFRLDAHLFKQGFTAVLPLWLASAPVAFAYAIAAREAGWDVSQIQLLSLTLYSASAQISTVQLLTSGTSAITIIITAVVLNLHHLLYGLSLARHMKLSRLQRATAAYFLTDGAYGITIDKNPTFSFLLGAEISLFIAWNLFTALGVLLGHLIVISSSAQLNFVAPLTFFVLLISSLKTRTDVTVALISAVIAVLCLSMQLGSLTILIVGITGAFIGARLESQRQPTPLAVNL